MSLDRMQGPASEKCMPSAIKCRSGPENPRRAWARRSLQGAPGTIRREFGSTLMVNAAHASDSAEKNAAREMGIVKNRGEPSEAADRFLV